MKNAHLLALAIVFSFGLAACGQGQSGSGPSTSKKSGPVVAKIGNMAITLDDLNESLDTQPITRSRLDTLERKKEFLDNYIRFEVLAIEAKKKGLDKDPEVLESLKRAMVQKMTQDMFSGDEDPVTEEEAKAYYDEHIHNYVKPDRVRASHIFFAAAEGDASRNKVRAEAQKALAELRIAEGKKDRHAFSQLAKTRSDDNRSKRAGGDLSFRTKEELTEMWGDKMASAAFSLQTVGHFADLVETERGFHIVKLSGRQDGVNRSFETVRAQIENRLSREKKTKAFESYVTDLMDQMKVEVNEEVLDQLEGGSNPMQAVPVGGGSSRPKAGGAPGAPSARGD